MVNEPYANDKPYTAQKLHMPDICSQGSMATEPSPTDTLHNVQCLQLLHSAGHLSSSALGFINNMLQLQFLYTSEKVDITKTLKMVIP